MTDALLRGSGSRSLRADAEFVRPAARALAALRGLVRPSGAAFTPGPPGSAPWTPLDLGLKLTFWLCADDTSDGITPTWVDRIGGATLTATPGQEAVSALVAGVRWLNFDGIDDNYLVTPVPAALPVGTTPGVIFAVVSQQLAAADTTSRSVVRYGGGSGARGIGRASVTGVNRQSVTENLAAALVDTLIDYSGPHLSLGWWKGTEQGSRIDGRPASPASAVVAAISTAVTRMRVGSSVGSSATALWGGGVRHLLVTTELTAAEYELLEGWAAWDGGLVAVLPPEHAYDARPPLLSDVVPAGASGAAALLEGEANGFAADFTYAVDAQRVAVKASSTTTEYAVDAFFSNAGTSPKQVFDVAGTLVWSPHNMALQSQAFDQTTPWNPFSTTTVTANAIAAPDGTTTADRIVEVATSANHQLTHANITTIAGATYTVSVYAKAGERNWLSICPTNTTPADWFDLTNGVVGTSANGGAISAAGDGWYRCSITYVAAAASGPTFHLRTANGQTSSYVGDITKGLYVWGAQLNRGSVPTAYLPTTTAARYGLALDYDPVTHAAKGLLCEPAGTNLLLSNATLSTQSVTVTAAAHTLSFWGTGTITLSGVSTAGPLVGTGASNRVSLTFTPTAGSLTLTVSGTVSLAQLETGTVATSPIPTYSATVTRVKDAYNVTPASINYSATAGSWWVDISLNTNSVGGRVIGNQAGQTPVQQFSTTVFSLNDGPSLQKTVSSTLGSNKVAAAFQDADRAITAAGLAPATSATAGIVLGTPGTSIGFGYDPSGGPNVNGTIRKVTYRPRRVANADLVTETT